MVLGVSGAKSFSGFMVAVRGDSRSPATPQPAAGRAAPGLGESAAPRCLRRRLMDHAAPGRLSRSAAARRLGTGVGSPSPHTGPRPPNRSGVPVGPRTAVLKGQQPSYLDHVTLQQLPPSAARTRPSPATPRTHLPGVWPRPTRLHLLPSHSSFRPQQSESGLRPA